MEARNVDLIRAGFGRHRCNRGWKANYEKADGRLIVEAHSAASIIGNRAFLKAGQSTLIRTHTPVTLILMASIRTARRLIFAAFALLACAALVSPIRAAKSRSQFITDFLRHYAPTDIASAPMMRPELVRTLSDAALAQTRQVTYYDPSYVKIPYPGGDVPINRGVCTDVIVRAYRKAGVDLQAEVHKDMESAFFAYPTIYGRRDTDTNIDHRRVPNLMVFFSRHGITLPISKQSRDYLPGDIVAWDLHDGITHIGLVVDRKNPDSPQWMVVHNIGDGPKTEDVLFDWRIIGHFRYMPAN